MPDGSLLQIQHVHQDDPTGEGRFLGFTASVLYGIMRHIKKATLLFEDRAVYPDGSLLEMRIWRLPAPDAERPHGLKYSLFYGRAGERIVGYDNERGKGDHRHYRDREEPYAFENSEQMVADFLDDVERERSRK